MTPKTAFTWFLRIALAGVFALSAGQKYIGDLQYISEFGKIGLGDWFRHFTAVLETVGVIAVLTPRATPFGASVLLVVTLGALVAQLLYLHVGWYHCAFIGAALIVLIWLTASANRKLA